jgi:hypothetical protein
MGESWDSPVLTWLGDRPNLDSDFYVLGFQS